MLVIPLSILVLQPSVHVGGIWQDFIVKNAHPKNMCYNGIGLCVQNINTILELNVNTIGRSDTITWRERESMHFDVL